MGRKVERRGTQEPGQGTNFEIKNQKLKIKENVDTQVSVTKKLERQE